MGLFSDLVETLSAGGDIAASRQSIAQVVRAGISEGLSGNAMQRELSGSGLGMRRGNFLQLVGEVRSSLGAGAWAAGKDPNLMPSAADIVPWSGGTPGHYLTRVNVYRRVQVGVGEYQVERRGLSFLSKHPMSPAQAVQSASDLPLGNEGTKIGELLGYEYNGTYSQGAA